MGKIGVYSEKTRKLQRRLTYEAYGLTFKEAKFYLYLGDKESDVIDINDFSNKVLFEVADRTYSTTGISVPVGMEQYSDSKQDFSRFGLINPLTDEVRFSIHIDDFETLGRPLVVGDVFEMPFFEKDGKKAFYEVTDVDFKLEKEKFICVFHASTLESSRKSRDIDLNRDNFNFMEDLSEGMDENFSEIINTDETETDFEKESVTKNVDYRNKLQSSFLDDPLKEL
jgi:hypothetical protein